MYLLIILPFGLIWRRLNFQFLGGKLTAVFVSVVRLPLLHRSRLNSVYIQVWNFSGHLIVPVYRDGYLSMSLVNNDEKS